MPESANGLCVSTHHPLTLPTCENQAEEALTMESHVRIGNEWITAPEFAIGELVVSVFDEENEDGLGSEVRTVEWWRGVVTGFYYTRLVDAVHRCGPPGWMYHVRVIASCDARGEQRWDKAPEVFNELELKRSRYTPRYFSHQTQSPNVVRSAGLIAARSFQFYCPNNRDNV